MYEDGMIKDGRMMQFFAKTKDGTSCNINILEQVSDCNGVYDPILRDGVATQEADMPAKVVQG